MKTQKCISILSLAVPGLLFGTSEALALPLPELIARVNPWAMVQADRPATAFAPVFCNGVSTPNNSQTVASVIGIVANPFVGWSVEPTNCSPGDRMAGELTEDLAQVLVQASLPLDPVLNTNNPESEASAWPTQSSAPDIETGPAAVPLALVGDELAASLPEPATLALLAIGLAGIGFKRKPAA
jgi:hypothetical protein